MKTSASWGLMAAAWVAATPALAADATVAVLPLTKAAASETYDGLGTALAGMLITDLSSVPNISLVERTRLDALMGEMKLAKSGFVDPKTAQKLGKGLGAQIVVVGSFSVIGKTFLLDARMVKVETGRILQAAKGQGTIDDFVAVEKTLVEGLLEGLEVKLSGSQRRKIYVQAPTEAFRAFSAYGEGLARKAQGRDKEAREAFERALAVDPRFEAARTALGAIRETVESAKAEERAQQASFRDASHAKVLDAYPSELKRKSGFEDDTASLAGFALRLMVLENEERYCEMEKEMRHFLDRVGWRVREPQRRRGDPSLRSLVDREAKKHGFSRLDSQIAPHAAARKSPGSRLEVFEGVYAFVIGESRVSPHSERGGLVRAIEGCYPGRRQLKKLDALKREVEAQSVGHLTGGRRANFDLTTSLDLLWAWSHAKLAGANAALSKRTKAMLLAVDDDPDSKREMIRYVEHILRMADMYEMHQLRRLGQTERTLVRVLRGVANRDAKVISTKGPYCAHLVKTIKPQAKGWIRSWDKDKTRDNIDFALDRAGPMYGSLRDMGCVVGQKARFRDAMELHTLLANIERYARPDKKDDEACISAFSTAEQLATDMMREQLERVPNMGPAMAHGYLMTLHGVLMGQGCVRLEEK